MENNNEIDPHSTLNQKGNGTLVQILQINKQPPLFLLPVDYLGPKLGDEQEI